MSRLALFATKCAVVGALLAPATYAQEWSKLKFAVGAGFTQPVRYAEGRLNTGFNLNAGVGANFHPHVGVMVDFTFNHLNISDNELTTVGVPDGSARVYSVTLNPMFHFNPTGRFDAYLTGGGGYYRRTIEFTAPTVDVVTAFDPFYGVFFPALVPATEVLGSFTQNRAGWNVGGGVTIRLKQDSNAKFFAETKYHYAYTSPVRTTLLPVTFGFRW